MRTATTAQLAARGLDDRRIARMVAGGELVRLRAGLYAFPEASDLDRHLALRRAADDILCLESAALVHGLPLLGKAGSVLHVAQSGAASSKRRASRVVHRGRLPADHVDRVGGVAVTTIARTVVDLARYRGRAAGIIPWEAALRAEAPGRGLRSAIRSVIDSLRGCRGIAVAAGLARFADGASESPMESLSRVVLDDLGVPRPVQQFEVRSQAGTLLGRADFAWPELGLLGEYDGRDKYDRLASPGSTPRDVMLAEKRRQQAMELAGWVFVRWEARHLHHPHLLLQAFQQAQRLVALRADRPPTPRFAA